MESIPVETREHILLVASNLFAAQGYHGTTTREIAKAVGIQQPSLFHHFDSKAAIMGALLEEDLGRSVIDRERLARSDEPAAVRLYRYIVREVVHIATSPYNVAGIYSEEVRTTPELRPWYSRRRRLHRAIDRIVRDGKASGEFLEVDSDLVRAQILGTLERAFTGYSAGKGRFESAVAEQVATLLLRSLLADPSQIASIRETVMTTEVVSTSSASPGGPPEGTPSPRISDATWRIVADAFPHGPRRRGGQPKDDREMLSAMTWRFTNGPAWRDLPARFGPWQTAWKRFTRWREDGTLTRCAELASSSTTARSELAWIFDLESHRPGRAPSQGQGRRARSSSGVRA